MKPTKYIVNYQPWGDARPQDVSILDTAVEYDDAASIPCVGDHVSFDTGTEVTPIHGFVRVFFISALEAST
jgi:hypothetical protein